ncbi:hypothetical protein F-LCD7_0220 [Faustovirus]|nr:hypothetical protein F-LCD7_0220 [Faustovirus]
MVLQMQLLLNYVISLPLLFTLENNIFINISDMLINKRCNAP